MGDLPAVLFEVRCSGCGRPASYTIETSALLTSFSERLLNAVKAKLDQLSEPGSYGQSRSETKALRIRNNELEIQLQRELAQRQTVDEEKAELSRRLEMAMSDQTTKRTDVGTALHTSHRSLSGRVDALQSGLAFSARKGMELYGMSSSDNRARSMVAARIFRSLFAPYPSSSEDREMLDRLRSQDAKVREMCETAGAIAQSIEKAGGYQCWLWDAAPPRSPFQPELHRLWRNSPTSGLIDFVVIPAYMVNGTIIAGPLVYVCDPEQPICDEQ